MAQRNQKEIFNLLRVLACLLVLNSHCRDIYPLYFFAIGGGFGNGIFCILSGYFLAIRRQDFLPWLTRRYRRVLPLTLMACVLDFAVSRGAALQSEVPALYYLNHFWFAWAILLFYPLFGLIFSQRKIRHVQYAILADCALYAVIYALFPTGSEFVVEQWGFAIFKLLFYFGLMLLGGLLRLKESEGSLDSGRKLLFAAGIVVGGALYLGEYVCITLLNTGLIFQFLIQAGIGIFVFSAIMLAISLDGSLTLPNEKIRQAVNALACSSLEVYLIQSILLPFAETLPFPISWILFVGISILLGIFVHSIAEKRM